MERLVCSESVVVEELRRDNLPKEGVQDKNRRTKDGASGEAEGLQEEKATKGIRKCGQKAGEREYPTS